MKESFQQECLGAPDWATHGLIHGREVLWLKALGHTDPPHGPLYRDSQGLLWASRVAVQVRPLDDDPRNNDPSLA